jgi:hypothetical protein
MSEQGQKKRSVLLAKIGIRMVLDAFAPHYLRSDRKLLAFNNSHAGETCVIVGNGPSLKRTDTKMLNGKYSFGMNRIYLGMEDMGFTPSFYVCVDKLVTEQFHSDFMKLSMPKFVRYHRSIRDRGRQDVIFLRLGGLPGDALFFSRNPLAGIGEGATVTYVAMQLAYWMGFHKVILIGVDHSFSAQGAPHSAVLSHGDDPNHFSADYFGKGIKWNQPDLPTSEAAYRMADVCFAADGREIVDCTVDGKCPVFRKAVLEAELER